MHCDNPGYFTAMLMQESERLHPQFRRMQFQLDSSLSRFWCAGDPVRTQFANAFSVILPGYERLFISAVSGRLKELIDPALKREARTFCSQEGQHAAVHQNYNRWLVSLGYAAIPRVERVVQRIFRAAERILPRRWLLAITAGGEHVTSFLANDFLSHPEKWSQGSDPIVAGLWQWHAAEEIEHKSVCFDVYQCLEGGIQVRRLAFIGNMLSTIVIVASIQAYLLWKDGQLLRWETLRAQFRFHFGTGGFVRGLFREGRKYLRKDFHPWHTRDGYLVEIWKNSYAKGN